MENDINMNIIKQIQLRNQQRKEKAIRQYLDRHYNVVAKEGVIYLVNGDSPVSALSPETTVADIVKQIEAMKQSFKSYTR